MKTSIFGPGARFVLVIGTIGLVAIAQAHPTKDINVQLSVSDSGTLEMQTPSGCTGSANRPDFPEEGCVRFKGGEAANVTFRFTGEPVCDNATTPPTKWQLDGIQLGNKDGLKPTTAQWGNPTAPLDAVVQLDFDVNAATGWINLPPPAPDGSITMSNNNMAQNAYYVWYRVRATCNGANPIYYDPRFDNEGGRG